MTGFCRNCGAELEEGALFCSECGQKIVPEQVYSNDKPDFEAEEPEAEAEEPEAEVEEPKAKKPASGKSAKKPTADPAARLMGSWGYIGYGLLFGIPLVGFILAIVFALDSSYLNRRNYARSVIIVWVIAIALGTVAAVLLITRGAAILDWIMNEVSDALQNIA